MSLSLTTFTCETHKAVSIVLTNRRQKYVNISKLNETIGKKYNKTNLYYKDDTRHTLI